MRRNGLMSLIFIVLLTIGGLAYTFAAGNKPLLGLDLQGGVSVVLQPKGEADSEAIGQAIQIIRQRVDAIGVAEPEIARQGDAIVVQLPGVKDRERALELVGQTAELRFRPVLQVIPPDLAGAVSSSTSTPAGDSGATTEPTTTPADSGSTTSGSGNEQGYGLAPGEVAAPLQTDSSSTTAPSTTAPTTTAPADNGSTTTTAPDVLIPGLQDSQLTPLDQLDPSKPVTVAEYDDAGNETLRYRLGPVPGADNDNPDDDLTGQILSGANARLQGVGTWVVAVEAKGSRIDDFNKMAADCYNGAPDCPTRQLAIVLDGRVVSAPSINAPSFQADRIQISGSFTESEAKDLALVLRYGALPVELVPQQTQSVSATIGKDALDAGVTAGIVGLILVALYMVLYYRLLGVIAILSLAVSASLLWVIIAYLGEAQGLALTLAGVTGIIVSIGVAVDSNVVFYEHLKEDVSRGRTLRTAVDGSFTSAFSTIVKADVASLIGAAVLYLLTVGPVRGFALYLGLSTMLDLVASYFFMRPLALILIRSRRLQHRPRVFGMPHVQEGVPA